MSSTTGAWRLGAAPAARWAGTDHGHENKTPGPARHAGTHARGIPSPRPPPTLGRWRRGLCTTRRPAPILFAAAKRRKTIAGGVSRRDRRPHPLSSPEGGGRVDDVDCVDCMDTESEDRCPQRPLRPCRPQRVRGGWAPRLPRGGRARGPAPTLGSAGARGAPGAPPVWRCPSGASSLSPFFLRNTHHGLRILNAVRARARAARAGAPPHRPTVFPRFRNFFFASPRPGGRRQCIVCAWA